MTGGVHKAFRSNELLSTQILSGRLSGGKIEFISAFLNNNKCILRIRQITRPDIHTHALMIKPI